MKQICRILAVTLSLLLLTGAAIAEGNIGTLPVTDEPITLTLGVSTKADVLSYKDNVLTRHLEEVTGVTLEFVEYSGSDANTNLELDVASGNKLPDIILFGMDNSTRRKSMGEAGAIIPLNDYYDREYGEAFKKLCAEEGLDYDLMFNQVVSDDGNLYAMIRYMGNMNNIYRSRAWINKTWLDKLGLEAPATYEELVEVAKAFRDLDPNGNGEKDEIPMVGSTSWGTYSLNWLQNMFIYTGGNDFLPLSETDGKLDTWYDKLEYREFLKYANMLVQEGLFSPLTFSLNQAGIQTLTMSSPCVAGIVFSAGAINVMNSEDEFVALEIPTGPEGKHYQQINSPVASGACAISADCEHPDIAFLFMNAFNIDRQLQYWNRFGEQDVNWRLPEEGEISIFDEIGIAPSVYELKQVWGDTIPQQQMWHVEACWPTIDSGIAAKLVFDPENVNEERWHAINVMMNMKYAPALSDVVATIVYTTEENEEWGEKRSALNTYKDQTRTDFVLGTKDPNNDADWEAYLKELEKLQYQEILAMQQTAYDRMTGK